MELIIFLPGMLVAYLPMKHHLRLRPAKLAAMTALLILLLCLAGEAAGCLFHIDILWLFFPAAVISGLSLIHI